MELGSAEKSERELQTLWGHSFRKRHPRQPPKPTAASWQTRDLPSDGDL